ncbi:MAG: PLP-dependent aminotransferase family protein, partial [Acidimicrobiia bacterium]|nr:PLP-dependent aminotransferase family protein [Acidimicrobiia bacterium]
VGLLIDEGDYHRAIRRSRKLLKAKWEHLSEAVSAELGTSPETTGGLSLWIEGHRELDSGALATTALRHDVIIEPGSASFLSRPAPSHFFRIGFSSIHTDDIAEGVRRIALSIRELA